MYHYVLLEELPGAAAAATSYAAFSTPQLDGRIIVQMVSYLLIAFICIAS